MKTWISLSSVLLLMLFAGATSLAQNLIPPSTPQAEQERPRNPQPVCPTISVSCPSNGLLDEPLDFKVSLSGSDSKGTLSYDWQVSGGVIVEGQGTPAVKVNISGGGGQSVTATVHVDGLDAACAKTVSCSTPVCGLGPSSVKVDSYGVVPLNKENTRLRAFAVQLKKLPQVRGYILVYGRPGESAAKAKQVAARSRQYLIKTLGIDPGRIVAVAAGNKVEATVDLWIVPPDADPPWVDPKINSSLTAVKSSRRNPSKH